MAQLTTSYQKIGTGSVKTFDATKARIDLYAKYNSQSTQNNNTEWQIEARLVKVSGGYIGEYTGTELKLNGDNISKTESLGTGNFDSRTLGNAKGTTGHNADGTKSVSASASMKFKAWGITLTVSGSATLPTIPRYIDIIEYEFTGKTETTATFKWNTSRAADAIQYSINDGGWINGSWPTTTITGLSANTTYNVKIRCKAQDSQLWTESSNKSITTYAYPSCKSATNFTIGGSTTLTFDNPRNRSFQIQMWSYKSSQFVTDLITINPATNVPYTLTPNANRLYESIPNDTSSQFTIDVWCDGNKSTKWDAGTYTINEANCKPTFEDFAYEDTNTTMTQLTGNNQILVNNYSNCLFTISTANKATAKNSASMSRYSVQWGSISDDVAYSSDSDVTKTISNSTGGTLKVIAIDSRGQQQPVQKTITYIPYINATISGLKTQREDGVDSKTYIAGKFNIYNGSWDGTNNANSQNRLKYVGYSVYKNNAWSTYYDITTTVLNNAEVTTDGNTKTYEINFDDEVQIHENGSSGGFTVGAEFPIKVLIKDGNSSVVFTPLDYQAEATSEVSDGTVATCLHKDSNGLYHLGINEMSNDTDAVAITGSVSINGSQIIMYDIVDTW